MLIVSPFNRCACTRAPSPAGVEFNATANEPLGQVEREYAAWVAAHEGVPGAEVHVDRDATWMVQPGVVWSNMVVQPRFEPSRVERRLSALLARYERDGRGVGVWVSLFAAPEDLAQRLAPRGFRCRKHYPAMHCDLRALGAA